MEGRMTVEDTELEEGELVEGRHSNFVGMDDLDRRVELVLGHRRMDFDETNLRDRKGPQFGRYGTFLPTRVRCKPPLAAPTAPCVEQRPVQPCPARATADWEMRALGKVAGGALNRNAEKVSVFDPAHGNKKQDQIEAGDSRSVLHSFMAKRNDLNLIEGKPKDVYNHGFGVDSSPSQEDIRAGRLPCGDEVCPGSPDSEDRSPASMIRIMTTHWLPHGGLLSPLLAPFSATYEHKENLMPALIDCQTTRVTTSAQSASRSGTTSVALRTERSLGKDGLSIRKRKTPEGAKATPSDRRGILQRSDSGKVVKDPPPEGVVLDQWILRDKCEGRRLIKPGFEEESLKQKFWECRIMNCLPGLKDCKDLEEQTAQAVNKILGMQNPNHGQANPGQQAQRRVTAVTDASAGSLAGPTNKQTGISKLSANGSKSESVWAKRRKRTKASNENCHVQLGRASRRAEWPERKPLQPLSQRVGFV